MAINTDYRNILSSYSNNSNKNLLRTFAEGDEDDGSGSDTPKTDETKTGEIIDAVFEDSNDKVTMDDFLALMVAQLKNQDFMNPMDDTQYITQLAQISSMQQMEEMNYNSKSTYVASLVGKTVTAAKFSVKGDLIKKEGIVERVSLLDGEFVVYVDGEAFDMNELMEIRVEKTPVDDANGGDNSGGGDGGDDGDDGGGET